jgi:hypothetical protein
MVPRAIALNEKNLRTVMPHLRRGGCHHAPKMPNHHVVRALPGRDGSDSVLSIGTIGQSISILCRYMNEQIDKQ